MALALCFGGLVGCGASGNVFSGDVYANGRGAGIATDMAISGTNVAITIQGVGTVEGTLNGAIINYNGAAAGNFTNGYLVFSQGATTYAGTLFRK